MSAPVHTINRMWPIIGTEAIAAGVLTRGELRWNHTALLPNIYLPKGVRPSVSTNAAAAWLWRGRKGVVAGRSAAALYGVSWIEETVPIELIGKHGRRQPGVTIRDERIGEDEICQVANLPVTTPARTALDLARRLPRDDAVAHLDALASKTGVTVQEVLSLAERYPHTRGIRQARESVALMDGGAETPRQTWLRLLLIDAGMPKPQTAIALADSDWETTVAIGWRGPKVGIDIAEDPVSDPYSIVQKIARAELRQRLGWFDIRVAPAHTTASIIYRVRQALRQRGAI